MAEKKIRSDVYIVNATFEWRGSQWFTAGSTVQAGHPVLRGREHLFRPFAPTHPWPLPGADPEPVAQESAEADEEEAAT